jgi:UDP-glucose 4-epimerase
MTVQNNMQNKNVLVTGGAGYIGGHLVNELVEAGYNVTVLDNLSTGKKENINPNAKFVQGDLSDEIFVKNVLFQGDFSGVFHMAASLEVEESVKEPLKYFKNNVENTIHLLEAMEKSGCKKIIFSSSAAVYGETDNKPVSEISPVHPNNPYGENKLLAESLIKYFCEYGGFKAVAFRYFNACGTAEGGKIVSSHSTHLVHNVLEVARGHKLTLKVFGNDYPTVDGTCIRDYVHVLDIVLPHILAFEKMENFENKFEIFNIGTGKGNSVKEVANIAVEVLGKVIPMDMEKRRVGDAIQTVADNSKMLNVLGYQPSHSSMENIIKTAWNAIQN